VSDESSDNHRFSAPADGSGEFSSSEDSASVSSSVESSDDSSSLHVSNP